MRPFLQHPLADPVEHAIEWHDGDTRATIRTLIDDCQHLRMQLEQ